MWRLLPTRLLERSRRFRSITHYFRSNCACLGGFAARKSYAYPAKLTNFAPQLGRGDGAKRNFRTHGDSSGAFPSLRRPRLFAKQGLPAYAFVSTVLRYAVTGSNGMSGKNGRCCLQFQE